MEKAETNQNSVMGKQNPLDHVAIKRKIGLALFTISIGVLCLWSWGSRTEDKMMNECIFILRVYYSFSFLIIFCCLFDDISSNKPLRDIAWAGLAAFSVCFLHAHGTWSQSINIVSMSFVTWIQHCAAMFIVGK